MVWCRPAPPHQAAWSNVPVVFVPLGYGPAVAARAPRLALLQGVQAEVCVADAATSRAVSPVGEDPGTRPNAG